MAQHQKETPEKYCKHCGMKLERKRMNGRLEDKGVFLRRKYCSRTCGNSREHPINITTYYLRARKHIKKYCEACGSTTRLQVHHIDQHPENNQASNIQTLCKSCHDFWHTTAKRLGKPIAGKMPTLLQIHGTETGNKEPQGLLNFAKTGWSGLEGLAMPKSRSVPQLHGKHCTNESGEVT